MEYTIRPMTIDDYCSMLILWGSSEQNLQTLDPAEDDYDGIARYLKRNSNSCFAAEYKAVKSTLHGVWIAEEE